MLFIFDVKKYDGGPIVSISRSDRCSTGRVSLARENEVGGRKSIFSMLTYRTLFCFWL